MNDMRKWIDIKESIVEYKTITNEEVEQWGVGELWGNYNIDYLHEILTGEYSLDAAREDILSFRKLK